MSDDKRMTDARKAELRERTVGESCFTDDEMVEVLDALDAAEADIAHVAEIVGHLAEKPCTATADGITGRLLNVAAGRDELRRQLHEAVARAEAAEARAATLSQRITEAQQSLANVSRNYTEAEARAAEGEWDAARLEALRNDMRHVDLDTLPPVVSGPIRRAIAPTKAQL